MRRSVGVAEEELMNNVVRSMGCGSLAYQNLEAPEGGSSGTHPGRKRGTETNSRCSRRRSDDETSYPRCSPRT